MVTVVRLLMLLLFMMMMLLMMLGQPRGPVRSSTARGHSGAPVQPPIPGVTHLPGAADFISGQRAVREVCAWPAFSRRVCVSSACLSGPLEMLLSFGFEALESALATQSLRRLVFRLF